MKFHLFLYINNQKNFRLNNKNHNQHITFSTESAHINALKKITNNFLGDVWMDVDNDAHDFCFQFLNRTWFLK